MPRTLAVAATPMKATTPMKAAPAVKTTAGEPSSMKSTVETALAARGKSPYRSAIIKAAERPRPEAWS